MLLGEHNERIGEQRSEKDWTFSTVSEIASKVLQQGAERATNTTDIVRSREGGESGAPVQHRGIGNTGTGNVGTSNVCTNTG